MVELEQLYFRDYGNYWGEVIVQFSLELIGSVGCRVILFGGLIVANLLLLQLLVEVCDNICFKGLVEVVDDVGSVVEVLEGVKGKLGKVVKLVSAVVE